MSDDFKSIRVTHKPQTKHHLGILVLDGSPSMEGQCSGNITKAQAVSVAVRDMLSRFKGSKSARNFSFAVVTFDDSARIHTDVSEALQIDDNASYNPLEADSNGTNIGAGLEKAKGIAEQFLSGETEGGVPRTVVIVVMSDGECGYPQQTQSIAEDIKQNDKVEIFGVLFTKVGERDLGAAQGLLRKIVNDPEKGYKTVYDAETLRDFFEASVASGAN